MFLISKDKAEDQGHRWNTRLQNHNNVGLWFNKKLEMWKKSPGRQRRLKLANKGHGQGGQPLKGHCQGRRYLTVPLEISL